MLKVAKEKGNVGLFAEGNRNYAEFQFHIDKGLARLIKTMKIPVLLFNIARDVADSKSTEYISH